MVLPDLLHVLGLEVPILQVVQVLGQLSRQALELVRQLQVLVR
jgi:hypothetical protein